LNFGTVQVGSTSTKTLRISNTGNSTLTVTSIIYPPGFSGDWSGNIPAGDSHDVTVTFSPTEVKTYSGTLRVSSNKTSGTNTKSISGIANEEKILQSLTVVPDTMSFSAAGQTKYISEIILGWSDGSTSYLAKGNATYSGYSTSVVNVIKVIPEVKIQSVGTGITQIKVSYTHNGITKYDYIYVTVDNCDVLEVISIGSNELTCNSVKLNGRINNIGCTYAYRRGFELIDVTTGQISIFYEDGYFEIGMYYKVLTTILPEHAYQFRAYASNSAGEAYGEWLSFITPSCNQDTRIIRLEGDLNFGDVQVGDSAQRTLTIYNDGNSTLNVTGINYSTPDFSGDWSGPISAGASQPVDVTFAPTQVKTYSGTLTVSSNKTDGTNTKSVSGTGTPITTNIIVTSPNGGEIWNVGETRSITWTVSGDTSQIDHFILGGGTNGSFNEYLLGTASSASRSYSGIVPNNPSTQCKIGVWAVDASGNALVYDSSDDFFTISPVIDTRIISLSGDTTFEDVHVSESKTQILTISNTGNSALDVTGISYPYSVFSGNFVGSIAAGASQPVDVTFAPTQVKTYDGTLTVSSNKTGGTSTKSINGTGVPITTTIIVTSPNGGEVWKVGETRSITWAVSGDTSQIHCFILQGGTNGNFNEYLLGIASNAARSYSDIVPDNPSTQCKIRVRAVDESGNVLAHQPVREYYL